MSLSLSDIDAELARRKSANDPDLSAIDAELQRRGVEPSTFMDTANNIAGKVASAVLPDVSAALEAYRNPSIREPIANALEMPKRGLQAIGTTAVSGIQRGAEAAQPGFKPEGAGEHIADLAASFGDPRNLAINPVAGEVIGAATNLARPAVGWLGKQAARGVQVASGVPAENVIATAQKPVEVLMSKLPGNSGKLFQKTKNAAGVTPDEERLIAGIGDPSGFKRVADDMAKKLEGAGDLTVGEALAFKKAAGELARKAKGSARFIYSQDAKKAEAILAKKAPDVLKAQKDVALSKIRQSFMSLLPTNNSGSPAVLRSSAALGFGATGNPLAALAMSPMLAAFPATVATGIAAKATKKGLNVVGENPAVRQALLAVLAKIKGSDPQ